MESGRVERKPSITCESSFCLTCKVFIEKSLTPSEMCRSSACCVICKKTWQDEDEESTKSPPISVSISNVCNECNETVSKVSQHSCSSIHVCRECAETTDFKKTCESLACESCTVCNSAPVKVKGCASNGNCKVCASDNPEQKFAEILEKLKKSIHIKSHASAAN